MGFAERPEDFQLARKRFGDYSVDKQLREWCLRVPLKRELGSMWSFMETSKESTKKKTWKWVFGRMYFPPPLSKVSVFLFLMPGCTCLGSCGDCGQ